MSYRVYPVVKTADECTDYEVYINGEKAELSTARVSAYPLNRRWPGHQRDIGQTERVNFLSMASDEEIELKIIPKNISYAVRIRPRSLAMKAKTDGNGVITVRIKGAAQFTVEPYGRKHALHVFIDPISEYGIDIHNASVLYFGPGEHDVGDIYLKSGQTLFIDEGAVVYASVFAFHAENIKILGRGILDNSKNKEKILYEINAEDNDKDVGNAHRDFTINFVCCKNVIVDGMTIRDALCYNIDSVSCENVHINNIKIIGCWRYNSDGVHFANCIGCSLTNSFLRTFDDSICVRGYANYEYARFLNNEKEDDLLFECSDILIKNCVVWNDWGKNLQIGTELYSNEVKNIRFEDCKLIHSSGRALTIWLVDNAKLHDISFKNTLVEYDDYMLRSDIQNFDSDIYTCDYNADYGGNLVNFTVSWHHEYSLAESCEELGNINGVNIENLQLYSVQKPLFKFVGASSTSMIENVTFRNVYWNGEQISKEFFERQTDKNEFVKNVLLEN